MADTRNKMLFILKLEFIKNNRLRRFSEHILYITIILLLIPAFMFELCVVLPTLVEHWSLAFFCHLGCASFLFHNFMGNVIYGMFTNTTIIGKNLEGFNKEEWALCSVCECLRPPRAWHCDICNICILKRDHHCSYFASCVGYFNHRYFMMTTFYMFVGMIYSVYYNIQYLYLFITWNHGFILFKFILPHAGIMFDFGDESVYIALVELNVIFGLFSGFLFIYHFINILKGRLVPEIKFYTKDFVYNKGWKHNVIEVFGSRWYLAWISPFIHSQLPGNGIEWPLEDKCKTH